MKRYIASMTIGLLAYAGSAGAIAGGPTLTLDPDASSVETGSNIVFEIVLDATSYEVTAVEIHVTFPEGTFEPVSFEETTSLPVVLTEMTAGTGTVYMIVGANAGQSTTGTSVAATLTLRALQEGSHDIGFGASTQIAASGEVGDVADTLTGVTIEVTGEEVGSSGGGSSSGSGSGGGTVQGTQGTPTPTPSVTQQASQVETGPGQVTVISLILAAIAAVAYVGYTSTDWFRRREAGDIVTETEDEKDRGDFK